MYVVIGVVIIRIVIEEYCHCHSIKLCCNWSDDMLSLKFGNVITLWCCNGVVIGVVIDHSNVVIQIDVILEGGILLGTVPGVVWPSTQRTWRATNSLTTAQLQSIRHDNKKGSLAKTIRSKEPPFCVNAYLPLRYVCKQPDLVACTRSTVINKRVSTPVDRGSILKRDKRQNISPYERPVSHGPWFDPREGRKAEYVSLDRMQPRASARRVEPGQAKLAL